LGKLDHRVDADVVHGVLDFRDMCLRDACLLSKVALA
jgi:hypothetical protein